MELASVTPPLLPPQSHNNNTLKRPLANSENDPQLTIKRAKAAERQRRKRERDRNAGLNMANVNQQQPEGEQDLYHQQFQGQPFHPQMAMTIPQQPTTSRRRAADPNDLSPEEAARRDRVRAAARERQRKHRALLKERKMRELGMDMGNEVNSGTSSDPEISFDPAYQELLQHGETPSTLSYPPPLPPPFPETALPPNANPGQIFATTLLLSFSCAPLLKQHLLNNLRMTELELASLEPLIAEAFETWNRKRQQQQQYDSNQAFTPNQPTGVFTPDSASTPSSSATSTPGESISGTGTSASSGGSNDFRARFRRPVVAPSPFQAQSPSSDTIDPSLAQEG
ncbi:hypothetical protein VNI00_008031 [Paramarasmius palmivorus]|uniref:BZIP domain-containing protein n=1 Tax=Paramarasmius palmivorus TaxID=297713 RepID=A0AAW0CXH0_9AGAR